MLLSIPLTIMIKMMFNSSDKTRWLGVLMGNGDVLRQAKSLNEA